MPQTIPAWRRAPRDPPPRRTCPASAPVGGPLDPGDGCCHDAHTPDSPQRLDRQQRTPAHRPPSGPRSTRSRRAPGAGGDGALAEALDPRHDDRDVLDGAVARPDGPAMGDVAAAASNLLSAGPLGGPALVRVTPPAGAPRQDRRRVTPVPPRRARAGGPGTSDRPPRPARRSGAGGEGRQERRSDLPRLPRSRPCALVTTAELRHAGPTGARPAPGIVQDRIVEGSVQRTGPRPPLERRSRAGCMTSLNQAGIMPCGSMMNFSEAPVSNVA